MDIVHRLNLATMDKDNFPRMDSERQVSVGLAREAASEIVRLRTALEEIITEVGTSTLSNKIASKALGIKD